MLANSCASYVQFRAGPAFVDEAIEANSNILTEDIRFIREHDEFVLKQDVPSQLDKKRMYSLSETKMEEFKQTLKRFSETLRKKKIFSKLGIPPRDPENFDLDYVLSIAETISEWDQKSHEMNACRRFAHSFCHKAVNNKNLLEGLISLAPSDAYGSLISGGFTIALAAMESHIKLRDVMEQSLARIPKELNKIKELSVVHIQRDQLHRRANDVLVSVFTVLERIIERLSRTWKDNISIKLTNSESSVEDALENLSSSIAEFNDEVELCAQLRMGRIEENSQSMKLKLGSVGEAVNETSTKITDIGLNLKEMHKKQDIQCAHNGFILDIVNRMYPFFSSNPAFNAADGTVNWGYLSSAESKYRREKNNKLINQWFRDIGEFQPSSKDGIKLFIEYSETLPLREQDRVQYIMACQLFQDWLSKPRSSAICMRAETAPEDIINFMSVSTAVTALTLGTSTGFIVLSCFCSLRKKTSLLERDSGALGIAKALIGQLFKIMDKKQLVVDLPSDPVDKIWTKSTESFRYSCALLRKLMALLPSGNVVFVLLDSVSRISGDKSLVDDLAKIILGVGRRENSIVVKLLVTDPVPSSSISKMANYSLYVPDDVGGWECGMNAGSIRGRTLRSSDALKVYKKTHDRGI